MRGIFLRWVVLTIAVMLSAYLLDGIHVGGFGSAFFAAAILGILNAFFRPILLLLTLPINILTFGLFTLVINAVLLMMASGVISGFEVRGFWSAVFGSLLIGLISWLINSVIGERGNVEVIEMRRTGKDHWEP